MNDYYFNFEQNWEWHELLDLTFAVWRVSGVTIDDIFLKDKINHLAIDILLEYPNINSHVSHGNTIAQKIYSQLVLLSFAQKISTAKDINFIILKNKYKKLFLLLDNKKQNNTVEKNHGIQETNKDDILHQIQDATKEQDDAFAPHTKQHVMPKIKKQKKIDNVADILNTRQVKILNFFNKRKEDKIKLKDVTKFFPTLTDRTIRNDLRDLCIKKMVNRSNGHGKASYYYLTKK